jgi:hypothetical protein
MNVTKSKGEMLAALSKNIPEELIVKEPVSEEATNKPAANTLVADAEEDYKFSRENVKKLISTSDEAISSMINLAQDSEHPRAFEVLAGLIKTAADVNKQLMDLQKDRKKLLTTETKRGETISNTTNNIVFAGPTSELQKILAAREATPAVVDV